MSATAMLVAVLLCGCSGDSDDPAPATTSGESTTPSATPSVTSTAESDEELALAAYRGMWDDTVEAAKTSDDKSPLLARNATGSALARIVQTLYSARQKGLVTKGKLALDPVATKAATNASLVRVSIKDCADTSHWLLYKKSGARADDSPGGRRQITATAAGLNGTWKVTDFQVGDIGSC
jgi:hypothetical protein